MLLYHIGTWNKDVPETGIFLTSGEMQSMEDAWFREAILEEYTEQERFQKDYLQQRENGSVEATLTRIKESIKRKGEEQNMKPIHHAGPQREGLFFMEKRKESRKVFYQKGIAISMVLCGILMGSSGICYADQFSSAAKQAAEGMQTSAQGAVKWIVAGILVVLGLIFLVGTQHQKENAKGEIFMKLIGVALIIGAIPIATLVFGWFTA